MKEENLFGAISILSNLSLESVPLFAGIVGVIVFTLGLGLLVYSLFTSGKKGWGWVTLLFLFVILAFSLRIAVSMFREVAAAASGSSGSDWDG